MGKVTKIIYTCDICGKESEQAYPTCKYCQKDYCEEHSELLKATISFNNPNIFYMNEEVEMCSECATKVDDWKAYIADRLGYGKLPEFIVKAQE